MSHVDKNPYQAPAARSHDRNATPWIILSAVLFALLMFMGLLFYRSNLQAARAREQARMQAQMAADAEAAAREALRQALEADSQ